jgi:hypothetical protein
MSGCNHHNTVSLIPGIDGDLQVVNASGFTLVDVQAAHRSVAGDLIHEHAFVSLNYSNVLRLRDLLDQIAEPVEPRQPALWSETTFVEPIRPPARNRRRRRFAA